MKPSIRTYLLNSYVNGYNSMLNSYYKKTQKNTEDRVQIALSKKTLLSENLHAGFLLREDSICIIIRCNSVKSDRKRMNGHMT